MAGIGLREEIANVPRDNSALHIVLADDNYLVREDMAALLREIDGVELVAAVDSLESLLEAVREHKPDAVVTDIRMPPTQTREGIDAARQIRASHPGTAVLLLLQHVEGAYVENNRDSAWIWGSKQTVPTCSIRLCTLPGP